jgi:plasmid maintenance system antidote protein VapI
MKRHTGRRQLADWMERRGFKTQTQAARFLNIGKDLLCELLSGKRTPGLDNAIVIERLTGIPVEAWSSIEFSNIDGDATADPSISVSAKR